MTQRFFITSSGTGVGKTLVTTGLCRQLRASGRGVTALKPIISGFDPKDAHSDSSLILEACGQLPTEQNIAAISPWRFAAPLSPDMAAAKEGKEIDFNALVEFSMKAAGDTVLIEGAGGVMSPINKTHTMLDWMGALECPVILVVGTYLGSISHTLTALGTLHMCGIKIQALVISESEHGVSLDDTAASIRQFMLWQIPVVKIPRLAKKEDMADITKDCGL